MPLPASRLALFGNDANDGVTDKFCGESVTNVFQNLPNLKAVRFVSFFLFSFMGTKPHAMLLPSFFCKRTTFLLSFFFPGLVWTACSSQKVAPRKTTGSVERLDAGLDSIVRSDAAIEIIAEGYEWSEGPVWVASQKTLLFSDVPTNTVYKWTEKRGAEVYLKPSGYTGDVPRSGEMGSNGLTLDNDGRLLLCQHGDRRVARMEAPLNAPKPVFTTVAGAYNNKKFNSPNDLAVHSSGDVYFTDPPYGLEKNMQDPKKELPFQGVYKAKKNGEVILLVDSISRPNGIALTPDEKTLLIANSDGAKPYWYAYDIVGDALTNGRIFYDATEAFRQSPGGNDGLKVDRKGRIFATGPGGVWIFHPSGKVLGRLRIPAATSNCALSDDEKTLFITADMNVLRVKMR